MLAAARDLSPGGRNRYFCAVRDNLILELLFSTGIRIGELVALDTTDVDLAIQQVHITGRATRGREVGLASDGVNGAFATYLELRSERALETPALFVGRSGTRLTIYSIENIFKKHVRVVPYPEDDTVGMIERLGSTETLLMGSDWPHAEGLREPADFYAKVAGLGEQNRRRFLRDNGLALLAG